MTDAEFFNVSVKRNGKLPRLLEDKVAVKFYKVTDVVMTPRFGAWKITQVNFEDDSYYNVGQPDQGPHVEEGEESVQ